MVVHLRNIYPMQKKHFCYQPKSLLGNFMERKKKKKKNQILTWHIPIVSNVGLYIGITTSTTTTQFNSNPFFENTFVMKQSNHIHGIT